DPLARVGGGLTRRVAGEPFLARLQELLRPTVVQVLIDPFLAAQLSNAVLAAQAFQHDADLLFSGMMPRTTRVYLIAGQAPGPCAHSHRSTLPPLPPPSSASPPPP